MVLVGLSKRVVFGLVLVGVTAGHSAKGDWHSFWHRFRVDYARNNVWPQPFVDVDAQAVQAPFAVMTHNGWRAHNTIGNELFREGDCSLNLAGSRRVEWIAKQAPHERRTIYVLRGANDDETNLRLASVHQSLTAMQTGGPVPHVVVTDIETAAASGGWATSVNRQWMQNLPAPKLPSTSPSGAAGATTSN